MSQWYCSLAGETSGPFSIEELRFLKDRGKLSPDMQVRYGAEGAWATAGTVPQLFPSPLGPNGFTSSGVLEPKPAGPLEESPEPVAHEESDATPRGPRPPAVPMPRKPTNDETRERILIGSSIVAGILLLLLLLLFLFRSGGGGGSQGTLAGRGVGDQPGDGVGGGSGAGGGDGNTDDNAQGADDAGEDVVFEGELTADAPPQQASTGEDQPPDDQPPPSAVFRVQRLENAPPAEANGNGGGGGGGLGDFKDRLDREGGKTGEVQITLIWNNVNDLDLHVVCPSGERIYYQHNRSRCNGELDVDMNADGRNSNEPVENVFWPEGGAPTGEFQVFVHHFKNQGAPDPTKFEVAIKYDGDVKKFSGSLRQGQEKRVHVFHHR